MTATTQERSTDDAGSLPSRGTFPIKANTLALRHTIAGLDSAGRAMGGNTTTNGCTKIVGRFSATYDNRNGSVLGGAAGAVDCEVEYGVFGWENGADADEFTDADVGSVAFCADNQTVTKTNGVDTRPIAGVVSEITSDGQVMVWMGPHVAALIVIAASEASQLDAVQIAVAALQTDAETANAIVRIPLTSFLDADGDPLAKFVSAGAPTFGFALADAEALCLRWNNDATPGTALCQVGLPPDLDDTEDMTLEFLCSKSGATVGDATTLTVTAFIIAEGDLHDADADCGGVSLALVGNAAAKTTDVLSVAIAAANVPANARSMTFTVTPTAGTLGTDDLMIHDVLLRYTRKLLAA